MKKSRARFVVLMVSIAAAAACTSRQSPAERSAQQEPPSGNRDALDESALKEFRQELADYVALHKKLESTLAPLPTETSPEKIHAHERELQQLLAGARARAQEGDLFVSEVRPLIRRIVGEVLNGPEGREQLREIREEAGERKVSVELNARYPDDVPLSAVPFDLLKALPQLPEELEYRFLGNHLILLDVHARMIADVLRDVLPR
jgi:chorismate mutase